MNPRPNPAPPAPARVVPFVGSVRGYVATMHAAPFAMLLFFASAGLLQLRGGRRERRRRTRVEKEQNVVSSPVRPRPLRYDAQPCPDR